jgi:hypothetical protein
MLVIWSSVTVPTACERQIHVQIACIIFLTKEITPHQIERKMMFIAFFDIDGLVHHEHIAWTDCYWSFLHARFAEVALCSLEEVVRQVRTVVSTSQ